MRLYEQRGLGQARRDSVEEPIVDACGRRTGRERRLPPPGGLQLLELMTEGLEPFAGAILSDGSRLCHLTSAHQIPPAERNPADRGSIRALNPGRGRHGWRKR